MSPREYSLVPGKSLLSIAHALCNGEGGGAVPVVGRVQATAQEQAEVEPPSEFECVSSFRLLAPHGSDLATAFPEVAGNVRVWRPRAPLFDGLLPAAETPISPAHLCDLMLFLAPDGTYRDVGSSQGSESAIAIWFHRVFVTSEGAAVFVVAPERRRASLLHRSTYSFHLGRDSVVRKFPHRFTLTAVPVVEVLETPFPLEFSTGIQIYEND
jgi:hypothetical protein